MISPQTVQEIEQIMFRYSFAMDTRQWDRMNAVFLPDAHIILGGHVHSSRDAGVGAIRGFIECCSHTHHVNTNILVLEATEDQIRTISNFRAFHRGRGARADEVLECMGTYTDVFRQGADGWRIAERQEESPVVIGDMEQFFSDFQPAA